MARTTNIAMGSTRLVNPEITYKSMKLFSEVMDVKAIHNYVDKQLVVDAMCGWSEYAKKQWITHGTEKDKGK